MTDDRFSLADHLFNAETVGRLAARFEAAGIFAAAPFRDEILADLPPLALKERIARIAQAIDTRLDPGFAAADRAIRAVLPAPLDPTRTDDDFGEFIYAPFGDLIEARGLDDPEPALDLLSEVTQRFSMEFAIRSFLNRWPDETLARLVAWTGHPHYHVRRLASESTRPRLPWGKKIGLDPLQAVPILDALHADPTRFVTRSVANHLNDLTRTHPDASLSLLKSWRAAGKAAPAELAWIERHSLRGLIKAGDARAMRHLGYAPDPDLDRVTFALSPPKPQLGQAVTLSLGFEVPQRTPLIIDYTIDLARAAGQRASRKSFKWKTFDAEGRVTLVKAHKLKAAATTFRLEPGQHAVTVFANGTRIAGGGFDLQAPDKG